MRTLTVLDIAILCHETNRAYCALLGDNSQLPWANVPAWQSESAIKGVEFHLANPEASDAASHESWLEQKRDDGWTYGTVKDPEKKTHPCFVPFTALPVEQQVKDALFKAVVTATRRLIDPEPLPAGLSGSEGNGEQTAPPLPPAQAPDPLSPRDLEVVMDKELRRDIDAQIQKVKSLPPSRERALTITKLQEGVMWLGMDLKRLNEANPYPDSKNPANTTINPTADGLKL